MDVLNANSVFMSYSLKDYVQAHKATSRAYVQECTNSSTGEVFKIAKFTQPGMKTEDGRQSYLSIAMSKKLSEKLGGNLTLEFIKANKDILQVTEPANSAIATMFLPGEAEFEDLW